MSFFAPIVAAVSSAVRIAAAATAAPLGAAGISTVKGGAPKTSATLSPAILKALQSAQVAHESVLAQHAPWLTHLLAALFILCAVGLVGLLAVQTTKQEGLSGTIGGRVESTYRPRLGFDQQLARLTSYVAIGMVFFAVLLSITGI